MIELYPGQEYVHRHNSNVKRAEENWMAKQTAEGVGSGALRVISAIIEKWPHESGICAPYYPSRCRRCQIAGALSPSRQGAGKS